VLEIGARATTINVSVSGKLLLMRSVAIGGNQLTRAVQEDFELSPAEAEDRKRREGLNLLLGEPRPAAVQAWLDNLIGEIRRSALSYGPAVLSEIVLVGGGAAVPGLAPRLQSEFGVEPLVLAATGLFSDSEMWGRDPATADRCLLAMAGALRAVGRSAWTVSLLPGELLQERRAKRLRQLAALGVVAVLALMVVLYLTASGEATRRKVLVERLEQDSKRLSKQQEKAKEVIAERERLRAQAEALQIVKVRRYASLELLRTIDFYAPKEVVLTHFTLRPDQPLELRGTAPNPGVVADLQHSLQQSPLVREAKLNAADRTTVRGKTGVSVNFTLQLKLWTQQEPEARAVSLREGVKR
jgi:Tfp pilus assembly protein PilN